MASLRFSSSICCMASLLRCCIRCCSFLLLLSSCICFIFSSFSAMQSFLRFCPAATLRRRSSSKINLFSCRSCSRSLVSARALRIISVLIRCLRSSNSLARLASSSSLTRCSSSMRSLSATWSTRKEERSSFLLHLSSISFLRSSLDLNLRSTSSSSCFLYSSRLRLVFSAIAELLRRSRATRRALAVSRTSGVVRPGSLYRAGPPSWLLRAVSCPSPSLCALTSWKVPSSSAVARATDLSSLSFSDILSACF
mmetsp:Transcript_30328/g.59244  ORF Transcript_30328/g.59244 Transcript_30328/m.59244 type:complete len:253 (-) Transcript_30328:201-959(-)